MLRLDLQRYNTQALFRLNLCDTCPTTVEATLWTEQFPSDVGQHAHCGTTLCSQNQRRSPANMHPLSIIEQGSQRLRYFEQATGVA